MKKQIVVLIFVLAAVPLLSQGIAGRRISAEVEFDYFLRYFAPVEKFCTIGGKVRVGYVVAKSWQVYAGVNYYKLNYLQSVRDSVSGGTIGEATDYINCVELDFTARYFLKGFGERKYNCIAPDGKYFEFGLIATKTMYKPGELTYFWFNDVLTETTSARLSAGIGNQQVWWDRVIANTGFLISAPLVKLSSYNGNTAPYMKWQMGHNAFRAYISIGVLL